MRNQPLTDALPPGWSTAPIGRLVEIRLGKMLQPEPTAAFDSLVPYLNAKAVRWDGINVDRMPEMWASPKDVEAYSVQAGDLLVCEGGEAGRSSLLEKARPGTIVQNSVHRLRPRGAVELRYVRYALCAMDDSGWFDVLCSRATIAHLTREKLASLRVPSPPLDDQRHISDFLDRETERIDALVAKKLRLIELLQEKRTALISHAVTKGLDPDVPMKDSGIDQLGQFPSHWMAERLAMFTDKITNGFVGPTRDILLDEGVTYLQSLHIKGNRITFGDDYFISPEWSRHHAKSVLKTGDVLVVQTGDIGQVAVVPPRFEGANCHALIIVSPVRSLASGEYLSWVLNSHYGYHALKRIQTGALHPHLNCTFVREILCPLPPLEEQAQIVKWVRDQNDRHDRLVVALEQAIRRLEEYRSALITAAVTGQIDVSAR